MESLFLILMFAAMYFLLIRPQQRRVKAQRALVASLAVGDEVVTIGGMLGRIITLDDENVEIETRPGTVLRFRRSAISGTIAPADDSPVVDGDEP